MLWVKRKLIEYLIKCLSTIESCYSNCGILIAGDFNRLQITRLRNNFQIRQIVHFPTRGRRTLDLMAPIERPLFGLSDHATTELQPKERAHMKQPTITIKARDLHPSKRQAMGTYLEAVDVCTMTSALETCAEKVWHTSHPIPKGALYRAPLDYIHTQRPYSSTSARPFPRGRPTVSGDKESCESRTKSVSG